jgi:hypothetical protein
MADKLFKEEQDTSNMKWADLCLVPGQEKDCIQLLKCIVIYNIIHYTNNIVYMNNIDVQPRSISTVEWWFMKDDHDDLHFCESPQTWTYTIKPSSSDFDCVNTDCHQIAYFLSCVFEGIRNKPSYDRMNRMIFELRKEFPLSCKLCEEKKKQLKVLDPSIGPFMKGPYTNLKKACKYTERHAFYMNKLLSQTRQTDEVTDIIQQVYDGIKKKYLKSIKDGTELETVALFRRNMIDKFRTKMSFISTRTIDFNEWVYCLIYLEQLQPQNVDTDTNQTFIYMLKKLWLLLNLYFVDEEMDDSVTPSMYIVEMDQMRQLIDMEAEDLIELKKTHPILRGDFFEE